MHEWNGNELLAENLALRARLDELERNLAAQGDAEAALAERTRQLEAVGAITAEITQELDLPSLLGLITRRAIELVGADSGSVSLWDEASRVLTPWAWHGYADWIGGVRLGPGEGVAGTAAQRREGLIVNDYRSSAYALPVFLERTQSAAVLAEPLLYRDHLVGVLTINRHSAGRPFTGEDQSLLRLFAAQAAIAIENARLYEAAQRELAEHARAEETLKRYRLLADQARDIVLFVRKDGRILEANRAALSAYGYPFGELLTLHINDVRAPETHSLTGEQLARADAEGILFETVHRRKDGGTFPVEVSSRGATLGGERVLLSIIRDITERKRAERELAERTRQMEAIRAVTAEITRELDLDAVLELIARRAAELTGIGTCTLWLWDEEAQALFPRAWHGHGEWIRGLSLRLGEGVAGSAAQRREGLIVNEYRTSPYAVPLTLEHTNVTGILAEPLVYGDRLLGVISLDNQNLPRPITQEDRDIPSLFAAQAAVAIENARLYTSEQKRRRQLETLLCATRSVMSGLRLEQILARIVEEAVRSTNCSHVKLLLMDGEAGVLRVGALHGTTLPPEFVFPLEGTLSGLVARTAELVYRAEVLNDPLNILQDQDQAMGVASYLGLPIKGRDGVLGVLTFNTTTPRQYSQDELFYLTSFADQAALAIENARLYAASEHRAEELETFGEIGRAITARLDLHSVLEAVLAGTMRLLDNPFAQIILWDETSQRLVFGAAQGPEAERVRTQTFEMGRGINGTVAQTREPMILNEYQTSPYAVAECADVVATITVPILFGDRILGVLHSHATQPGRRFSADDLRRLQTLATQTAIAIENARLFQQEHERWRQLEAVRLVGTEIARELDLAALLVRITRSAAELVGGEQGVLFLWDEESQSLVPQAGHGVEEWVLGLRFRLGEAVTGTVAQNRRGMIVNDFRHSPFATPALLEGTKHTAVLAEPLLYRDRLVGVIAITNGGTNRTFAEQDRATLSLFAGQAAIAIENARLHHAAVRRGEELAALVQANQALASSLDLGATLQAIVREAAAISGAVAVRLLLLDEGAQALRYRVGVGVPPEMERDLVIPVGESFSGQVAATGEPLAVADCRGDRRLLRPEHTAEYSLISYLGLPVKYQDALFGVLVFNTLTPHTYTADEISYLSAFARQAALAIQNARLYRHVQRELAQRQEAEAQLRQIVRAVEQSPASVVITDTRGAIMYVNPKFTEATGYTLEEVLGRNPRILKSGEMPSEEYARLWETITRGNEWRGEFHNRKKNGELYWEAASISPVRNGDGVITHFVAVKEDITERKQAEQALAEHARHLEAIRGVTAEITQELDLGTLLGLIIRRAIELVGVVSGVVWLWDEGQQVLVPGSWHGRGDWMVGRTQRLGEGVVGTAAQRRAGMLVNDLRASPFAMPDFVQHSQATAVLAEPLLYGDRLLGVISVDNAGVGRPFRQRDREVLGLLGAQAAVAIENARLHTAAVRRGAELEALLRATRTVMAELDLQTILQRIVAEAAEITGCPHVKIRLLDRDAGVLRLGAYHGETWSHRLEVPLAEGLSGLVATTGQPVFSEDTTTDPRNLVREEDRRLGIVTFLGIPIKIRDQVFGVLGFSTTAPRRYSPEDLAYLTSFAAQAAIAIEHARLFAELNESYRDLQLAQDELIRSEKLRGLGQMAAGIAHDLNNMLAAILGQVELLRFRVREPDIQAALTTLATAAADGAHVVRRLQGFSRQQPTGSLAACDLATLVEEVVELTRPRWRDEPQRRGHVIEVRTLLDGLPPILGNGPEIREALTNLILNALDAMPEGGTLTLAAHRVPKGTGESEKRGTGETSAPILRFTEAPIPAEGEWVELTVADTGKGMSEDVRQRVFDPFFTTKGVQGTGLGLSLAYGIMERHGGRIAVTSAPGQGTTFTLRFQAASHTADVERVAPLRPVLSRRILVIDDDPMVRRTIVSLLQAAGHIVDEADGGAAGVRRLGECPVDLVLTDLGMPEVTGWDVARAVKAARPALPVLLLTGWGDQPGMEGVESAKDGLVDRIVGKPFHLEELLEAIAELTERQEA